MNNFKNLFKIDVAKKINILFKNDKYIDERLLNAFDYIDKFCDEKCKNCNEICFTCYERFSKQYNENIYIYEIYVDDVQYLLMIDNDDSQILNDDCTRKFICDEFLLQN